MNSVINNANDDRKKEAATVSAVVWLRKWMVSVGNPNYEPEFIQFDVKTFSCHTLVGWLFTDLRPVQEFFT
jgi:hypothetical protein